MIIRSCTFHYKDARSDKVYHAYVELEHNGLYRAVGLYGRRGPALKETVKCENAGLAGADFEFNEMVRERDKKRYSTVDPVSVGIPAEFLPVTPGHNASPSTPRPVTVKPAPTYDYSDMRPQLLNAITEEEAERYITDDGWGLQEKKNGERLMVRKDGRTLSAANRNSVVVPLSPELMAAYVALGGSFVVDGELVDNVHYVFDLLEDFGTDLRPIAYAQRYAALQKLVGDSTGAVQLVELVTGTEAKRLAFNALRSGNLEGAVFKKLAAAFTEGKPASGGDQLKCKFWVTASVIVTGHNAKRSVRLECLQREELVVTCECGLKHKKTQMADCDAWKCKCGNNTRGSGFFYVDVFGNEDDTCGTGIMWCPDCGKLIAADGVELTRHSVGNVTVKPKQEIPAIGMVVEVEYLHIVDVGGHLVQPELLTERTDVLHADCLTSQLKVEAAA